MSSPGGGRGRRPDMSQLFEALQKEVQPQARTLSNSVGIKLVLIPSGTYLMGLPTDHPAARANEMPQHEVILTQPIYMASTPITQDQYEQVMAKNPSKFTRASGGGPDNPVDTVTWNDAVQFCKQLSARPDEKAAGRTYRLPTEAEWEYACRSGADTLFAYGDSLAPGQGNFDVRFPMNAEREEKLLGRSSRVGAYPANNFGLFDMHGNVWEWCGDWYGENYYAVSPTRDPQGPSEGQYRVARGGCWRSHAATCRAAYRNALAPHNKDPYTGFRVVCVVKV